jgi:ethanolamine ammonia-lyase large subunit
MVYRHTIDATSYVFDDLRDLLAKATPLRSGDPMALKKLHFFMRRAS